MIYCLIEPQEDAMGAKGNRKRLKQADENAIKKHPNRGFGIKGNQGT